MNEHKSLYLTFWSFLWVLSQVLANVMQHYKIKHIIRNMLPLLTTHSWTTKLKDSGCFLYASKAQLCLFASSSTARKYLEIQESDFENTMLFPEVYIPTEEIQSFLDIMKSFTLNSFFPYHGEIDEFQCSKT